MRAIGPVIGVVLLGLSALQPCQAADGVVLPTRGGSCETVSADAEFAAWSCPGPAGYRLNYSDSVMSAGVSFSYRHRELASDSLQWPTASTGIGSQIEWRLHDGQPIAAIAARWRRAEAGESEATFQELLVIKISPTAVCQVGAVGAFGRDALASARAMADGRAAEFKCGKDRPIMTTSAADGSPKLLDKQLLDGELFDHNGSLVELTRSGDGVEIRYKAPRKGLDLTPGALLFRGELRNGVVRGEAFVFKTGCTPAGYAVSGRRSDGTLMLQGAAPRRAKSGCAIIGQSANSPNAYLSFTPEPVFAAEGQRDAATITIAECSRCPSAAVTSIAGVGTATARLKARITPRNIAQFCEGEAVDPAAQASCVRDTAQEIDRTLTVEANCAALTIKPSVGGEFRFFKIGEDYGGRAPTWTNLATGEVECGARSCRAPSFTTQFSVLCPGAIPGWHGRGL